MPIMYAPIFIPHESSDDSTNIDIAICNAKPTQQEQQACLQIVKDNYEHGQFIELCFFGGFMLLLVFILVLIVRNN